MKFTLIHPSRGRATKAIETYNYWMKNASGKNEIKHIISLDDSDTYRQRMLYHEYFKDTSKIITNTNSGLVEATNHAAKLANGDILVYGSDDIFFPENWDELIISKLLKSRSGNYIGHKWLLRVNDGYQPFENLVLTIPIMSIDLYRHLGYFFNPIYKSMWCDADLYCTCQEYIINAPDLLFKHERLNDEINKRSELNFERGRQIFNERAKEFNWPKVFNNPNPII